MTAATAAADIAIGSKIRLKVVHEPTNAAARKTIIRLLGKDSAVVAQNRRHRGIRKKAQWNSPRGNRWRVWESRLAKQHPVSGRIDDEGTIAATYDVLGDLASVERFVEISPA